MKLTLSQREEDLKKGVGASSSSEMIDLKQSHGKLETEKKKLETEMKKLESEKKKLEGENKRLELDLKAKEGTIDKSKVDLAESKKKLTQEEEEKKKLKQDLEETKKEYASSLSASAAHSTLEKLVKEKEDKITALEKENKTHKQKAEQAGIEKNVQSEKLQQKELDLKELTRLIMKAKDPISSGNVTAASTPEKRGRLTNRGPKIPGSPARSLEPALGPDNRVSAPIKEIIDKQLQK